MSREPRKTPGASRSPAPTVFQPPPVSRFDLVLLAALPVALLTALVISILLSAPRADADCSMYLQAAGLLLDGQRPYVDFVDVNPPMIIYLNAIPVTLARLVGAHPLRAFALVIALLAAWSARSAWSTLSRGHTLEESLAASLVATSVIGLSAWLWCINDHGQREHIMLLLYLPYLCARVRGGAAAPGRAAGFLRGFAAGVGISAKPHYVALAGVVEVYCLLLRRDPRLLATADFAGLLGAGLAYAGHFALLPADIYDAFFHRWLPLIRRSYAVYDVPLAQIWDWGMTLTAISAVAVLLARLRWRGVVADVAAALALATVVSLLLVLAQGKGWYYHRIPMLGFRAAAAGCIAASAVAYQQARARSSVRMAAAAAVGLALVAFASSLWGSGARVHLAYPEANYPLREFVRRYSKEGDRVLVCSTGVEPAYPILAEENRLPGSRYLWLFPLAMMAKTQASADEAAWFAAEEQRFVADLNEDVTRSPPDVLITPAPTQGAVTVTDYLRSRGIFATFGAYEQVGTAAGFAVYARPHPEKGER